MRRRKKELPQQKVKLVALPVVGKKLENVGSSERKTGDRQQSS